MKTKKFFLTPPGSSHHDHCLLPVPLPMIRTSEPVSPADDVIGLANPAAVYCEGLGYDTEDVERNGGYGRRLHLPGWLPLPPMGFSGRSLRSAVHLL